MYYVSEPSLTLSCYSDRYYITIVSYLSARPGAENGSKTLSFSVYKEIIVVVRYIYSEPELTLSSSREGKQSTL